MPILDASTIGSAAAQSMTLNQSVSCSKDHILAHFDHLGSEFLVLARRRCDRVRLGQHKASIAFAPPAVIEDDHQVSRVRKIDGIAAEVGCNTAPAMG
jgi:hypothetical protein